MTSETYITHTVHKNILTIWVRCFRHAVPAHTNRPLCAPSEIHQKGTIPNDEAHQLLPYLRFNLRKINHVTKSKTALSLLEIKVGNKK